MTIETILKLYDADKNVRVAALAKAVQQSPGHVYAVLREHRPKRKRSGRPDWSKSKLRAKVAKLFYANKGVTEIASKLEISRTLVYRYLPEVTRPPV